jgi:hypothetical protein
MAPPRGASRLGTTRGLLVSTATHFGQAGRRAGGRDQFCHGLTPGGFPPARAASIARCVSWATRRPAPASGRRWSPSRRPAVGPSKIPSTRGRNKGGCGATGMPPVSRHRLKKLPTCGKNLGAGQPGVVPPVAAPARNELAQPQPTNKSKPSSPIRRPMPQRDFTMADCGSEFRDDRARQGRDGVPIMEPAA